MKSVKNIILICGLSLGLASCDYLGEKPYEYWQPEDTFIDYDKTIQLLNSVYVGMPNGFIDYGASLLETATDDAIHVDPSNSMNKLAQGFVTEINPIENPWMNLFMGIRRTLYFEQYIPLLQNNAGWTDAQIERYKELVVAESKTARALYYFELTKRYGGVPLIKRTYSLDDEEIVTIPRNTYKECIEYIVELCDEATTIFKKHNYITNHHRTFGFLSTSACPMAIKAKTLAYAASPLFNGVADPLLGYTDSNVKARWEAAAEALKEVIDLDPAKLKLYADYEKLFYVQPNQNTEYIVYAGNAKSSSLERSFYPPSLLGSGTVSPSQSFVDAFEKKDGSVNDFSSEERYDNLDPRFYKTVVYDGASLGARGVINISNPESQDAINKVSLRSTLTGYYLRKFVNTTIDLSAASVPTTYHYFPVIRLADILLLYAEAMNEAYGPQEKGTYDMSAVEALNKVRERAGVAPFETSSYEEMKNKIINERRVELSFEGHRYFDLRRWKLADKYLNEPVTGFRILKENDLVVEETRFTVDNQRKFNTKMYYAPIPFAEMQLNQNLVQNPGWR